MQFSKSSLNGKACSHLKPLLKYLQLTLALVAFEKGTLHMRVPMYAQSKCCMQHFCCFTNCKRHGPVCCSFGCDLLASYPTLSQRLVGCLYSFICVPSMSMGKTKNFS